MAAQPAICDGESMVMKIFIFLLTSLFLSCAPEKKAGEVKMDTGDELAKESSSQAVAGESAKENFGQAGAVEDAKESSGQADTGEDKYGTIMEFLRQKGKVGFSVDYPDTTSSVDVVDVDLFSDGRIHFSRGTSGVYFACDKPEILDKKMTVNFVLYLCGQAENDDRGESTLLKMRFEIDLENLVKKCERREDIEFLLTVVDGSYVLDRLRFMAQNPILELFAVKPGASGYEQPDAGSKVSDRDVTYDLWRVVDIAHDENNKYWLKGQFLDSETLWFCFEDVAVTEKDYSWIIDYEFPIYDPFGVFGERLKPLRIYYSPDKEDSRFYDLDAQSDVDLVYVRAILRKPFEDWFLLSWYERRYDIRIRHYGWVDTLGDNVVFHDQEIVKLLTYGLITEYKVRIRAEPNLSSEILGTLNDGDKVKILEVGREKQKAGDWESARYVESILYKIRTNTNVEGWVFGRYVSTRAMGP
jgi:hypothetical protein